MRHVIMFRSSAIALALATGIVPATSNLAFAQQDAGSPPALRSDAGRPTIGWDAGGAVGAGTGCFLGVDAMIATNGDDVAVVFTNLGVSLGGDVASPLADVRTCTVKVPATVPAGVYPDRVAQTFTYGIRKTAASSGSLTATATFFEAPLHMPAVLFDAGVVLDGSAFVATQAESYAPLSPVYASFCRAARPMNGTLVGNISARGEVANAGERFMAFTEDFDLRWDMQTSFRPCTP